MLTSTEVDLPVQCPIVETLGKMEGTKLTLQDNKRRTNFPVMADHHNVTQSCSSHFCTQFHPISQRMDNPLQRQRSAAYSCYVPRSAVNAWPTLLLPYRSTHCADHQGLNHNHVPNVCKMQRIQTWRIFPHITRPRKWQGNTKCRADRRRWIVSGNERRKRR